MKKIYEKEEVKKGDCHSCGDIILGIPYKVSTKNGDKEVCYDCFEEISRIN